MSDSSKLELPENNSTQQKSESELFVVGIGASAGGLNALEELFSNVSTATGAAFVVIQHLSPDFKSHMKELLGRHTTMPVYRVTEGMELQSNSVYLIPPGQNLVLDQNILHLENRNKNNKHELNFPIDLFFSSLAKNYGEQSIGVILSGTGSDGTQGLKAINEAGGIALVQDPETAEFDGMPLSAISTGVVNQVLPPRELSQLIYQCVVNPINTLETEFATDKQINSHDLSRIAKLLIEKNELDFSQYKSSTISRRIYRRLLIHNSKSIDDYIKLLNESEVERQILCSDLLINVTHFFRDHLVWQNLENNILPRLIEQSQDRGELRFWITACSTGEEAYSLAILVHEAIQDLDRSIQVKIFATDIDRVALEKASQGIYSSSIVRDVSSERLQKYFVAKDDSYQIIRKIREMLIFSAHDLTQDVGFTNINLVSCRNVLIYMKSDLQYQVLRKLHFSLVSKGILFLGEAETLGTFESEFEPLDKKWKFFQKKRDIKLSLPVSSMPKLSTTSSFLHRFSEPQSEAKSESILEESLERLSDESDSVILMISKDNHLLHVSGDSGAIFKPLSGKPTTEVLKMVIQPLQLPLNTALHRARENRKVVEYQSIKFDYQGEVLEVSLKVIPPHQTRKQSDFFLVKIQQEIVTTSLEIPTTEKLELGREASQQMVELENELQQTRENLQVLIEELETTNEEQQSSNEELTSSNEELQSTNEELHSVNEELHTVNVEYQSKIQELTQLNNDVDNLLKSTEIGVIFLDSDLRIRKFTPAATQLISLRESDLKRPLVDLHWKIECPQLYSLLESVLDNHQSISQEVELRASNTFFLMQINIYLTEDGQHDGLVINFVNIDKTKKVQLQLETALAEVKSKKTEIDNFFKLSLEIMCVANLDGYFKRVNPSFERILGHKTQELLTQPFISFVHPDDIEATLQTVQELSEGQEIIGFENRYRCQDGSYRWIKWMASSYEGLIYATAHDLTEEKLAQEMQNRQLAAIETATNGIAILNEDKFIYVNQAHVEIFGYSQPEDLLGKSWQMLYKPEDVAQIEKKTFPFLLKQRRWQGVVKAKHRDGHLFDEELTLTFTDGGDLICVCQDVTERLKMEKSLIESEKKYRYLYQNTPVMLHSIDSQGRIISVSKYWLEKMGYSSKEVIGKKSTDFLTPESQKHAQEILPDFFLNGSCYDVLYQWVCKDGTIVDGLLSAISEMSEGKIVRSLAVVVDITEQRQKEKLEEENRAKDKYIAHMSQELRTPLNIVLGSSNILKQDSRLNQEQLKTVDIINQSGQHLLTLINEGLSNNFYQE